MVHRICAAGGSEGFPYLQRLWSVLLASDLDPGSKLERLFSEETAEFDLNTAFLSRIDPAAETQHFEVVCGPHETVVAGATVPLSDTYCRKTVADPEGTMAVSDALAEGWADDPAYERFGFGSYVGTTVTVEGELYGTVCFANADPRDDPITDEEEALVEMHGRWATYELDRWTGPPTSDTLGGGLDERDVPLSPRIDSAMDALGKRPRRAVLLALLSDPTGSGIDVVGWTGDAESARLNLQHVHLPKLEEEGYVEWDRDANTVSRGPNFAEIEPLLRLLKNHTTEFPE